MTFGRLPDRMPRSGLFELLGLCRCAVRIEILLAVFEAPDDVAHLTQRLHLEVSHVSRYLQQLLAAGLVTRTTDGHRHVYSPGPAARVQKRPEGLTLSLSGANGAEVVVTIPQELAAELFRQHLVVVIRDADAEAPALRTAAPAPRDGPAPAPEGSTQPVRRRPSGPR